HFMTPLSSVELQTPQATPPPARPQLFGSHTKQDATDRSLRHFPPVNHYILGPTAILPHRLAGPEMISEKRRFSWNRTPHGSQVDGKHYRATGYGVSSWIRGQSSGVFLLFRDITANYAFLQPVLTKS